MSIVKENLNSVLNKIEIIKNQNEIKRDVRLVAVSKTKSIQEIIEAYNAGQRHFGENYVFKYLNYLI
jgi:uncharacterized pyridoxal phosphate-containing UPF0001 family protein